MDITGSLMDLWHAGDSVTRATALLLLGMSLVSWSIILWKLPAFWNALTRLESDIALLWGTPRPLDALQGLRASRPSSPLLDLAVAMQPVAGESALPAASLTKQALRMALHRATRRLQTGLTGLASIGATAPFVGLLGTVWGIYHALVAIGAEGQATLDRIAGPVGEALIMTAAGLAVAIPAVLAYNMYSRRAVLLVQVLDGVAHDFSELALHLHGPQASGAVATSHTNAKDN